MVGQVEGMVGALVALLGTRKGGFAAIGLCAAIAAVSCACGAFSFSGETRMDYSPTSDLKCYSTFQALETAFPDAINQDKEAILIRSAVSGQVLDLLAAEQAYHCMHFHL